MEKNKKLSWLAPYYFFFLPGNLRWEFLPANKSIYLQLATVQGTKRSLPFSPLCPSALSRIFSRSSFPSICLMQPFSKTGKKVDSIFGRKLFFSFLLVVHICAAWKKEGVFKFIVLSCQHIIQHEIRSNIRDGRKSWQRIVVLTYPPGPLQRPPLAFQARPAFFIYKIRLPVYEVMVQSHPCPLIAKTFHT